MHDVVSKLVFIVIIGYVHTNSFSFLFSDKVDNIIMMGKYLVYIYQKVGNLQKNMLSQKDTQYF